MLSSSCARFCFISSLASSSRRCCNTLQQQQQQHSTAQTELQVYLMQYRPCHVAALTPQQWGMPKQSAGAAMQSHWNDSPTMCVMLDSAVTFKTFGSSWQLCKLWQTLAPCLWLNPH
jgi:hypothetical protein